MVIQKRTISTPIYTTPCRNIQSFKQHQPHRSHHTQIKRSLLIIPIKFYNTPHKNIYISSILQSVVNCHWVGWKVTSTSGLVPSSLAFKMIRELPSRSLMNP
eukprot:TRINITY_DN11452_c0_g1_i1.p1 TRINITY_DN11452_c0_g1~~TRINITY_DN11452_c0_g1_i1.p1  ORF type:complete len:102 (+),score=4.51 TRINITY_DN11452_c0_g1_i1:177-482(+)